MENYCNNCVYSTNEKITDHFIDWYCNYFTHPSFIGDASDISGKIKIPQWCPLCFVNKKNKEIKNIKAMDEEKEWKKLPTMTDWDDIEVNVTYHIPPINGGTRKDIKVTFKCKSMLSYEETLKGGGKHYASFYPSSLEAKFLVKNKLAE